MDWIQRIDAEIKTAMKKKEKDRLAALRSVKSEFLLAKTSGKGRLTEEQGIKIIQKLVKQRTESAEIYKKQNRDDLYQEEMAQAEVLKDYLPKQLSDEELTNELKDIVEKVGAKSPGDMGKVMGIATKQLAGKAEGKRIAATVKEILSKL